MYQATAQATGLSRTRFLFNLIMAVPTFGFLGMVGYTILNYEHLNRDSFAEQLEIPADLEFDLPQEWPPAGFAKDEHQAFVKQAFLNREEYSSEVKAELSNLKSAVTDHPQLLERFLATHQGWRLHHDGSIKETQRRWIQNGSWLSKMDRCYPYNYNDSQLQFSTSLKLKWGQRVPQQFHQPTIAKNGELVVPTLHASSYGPNWSQCFFHIGNQLQLQITETSPVENRAVTQSSLDFINKELEAFAGAVEWKDLKSALSSHFREGPESLEIYQEAYYPRMSDEVGSYSMCLWINPGEPGSVYMKAFEVTKNHPLSETGLRYKTSERIGWSTNPEEKFFANSTFSIREGESGQPYAARFEVWFRPLSGEPERKLMEKVILIEGADNHRG